MNCLGSSVLATGSGDQSAPLTHSSPASRMMPRGFWLGVRACHCIRNKGFRDLLLITCTCKELGPWSPRHPHLGKSNCARMCPGLLPSFWAYCPSALPSKVRLPTLEFIIRACIGVSLESWKCILSYIVCDVTSSRRDVVTMLLLAFKMRIPHYVLYIFWYVGKYRTSTALFGRLGSLAIDISRKELLIGNISRWHLSG